MQPVATMDFLDPKLSSPPAIAGRTWFTYRESAVALPAQAGSGMATRTLFGRSWMQRPRPGIRRQHQTP